MVHGLWHNFFAFIYMGKQSPVLIGLFFFVIIFFAFVRREIPGTIKGRVKPYNAALHAWAVSADDTGTGVIQNGAFEIKNLKSGRYRVIVEGLRPYKTTTKPDVIVTSDVVTDVGEIVLDQ